MFDIHVDVVVFGESEQSEVFREQFDGGFRDEHVVSARDGVLRDGVVRRVGCEDCYCGGGGERVDGGRVG